MNRFLIALCGVVLLAGCAATAVEFKWDEIEVEVCENKKVEGKKKFFVFPVYEKKCETIKKMTWVNVTKFEVKGLSVKADFKERKMEGGSFLPDSVPIRTPN